MAKLQIGSQALDHSTTQWERPAETNVRQFLTRINQDFKQSKADQILRLLRDQDTLNRRLTDCGIQQLEIEVDRDEDEDTLVSDEDTQSDNTLSDSSLTETDKRAEEGRRPPSLQKQQGGRSKTSVGFYNDTINTGRDNDSSMEEPERHMDTRFNRPKSSYVRRRPYRRTEPESGVSNEAQEDVSDSPPQRLSRSARPRSRLGNRPVHGDPYKRKIPLTEMNGTEFEDGPVTLPTRDEINNGATSYDRYASTRTSALKLRKERSNVRTFCDDSGQQMMEDTNSTRSPANSVEVKEETTEIQTKKLDKHSAQQQIAPLSSAPQIQHQQKYHQATIHQQPAKQVLQHHLQPRPEPQRPRNPEPIMSRPIGRADIRPNTRRRLERRYMQQHQKNPLSSARPTSESVILARQKTEKNFLKAQAANDRPKSERILIGSNKSMLSVSRNPAQGPQTFVNSKADVSQSSHVHTSGFRGYDPGSRGKDPSKRDLQTELIQPRPSANNVVVSNRRPLALMKLPPLEAGVGKKAERGLSIARETCV